MWKENAEYGNMIISLWINVFLLILNHNQRNEGKHDNKKYAKLF